MIIPTPQQIFIVFDVAVVQRAVEMLIELRELKIKGPLRIYLDDKFEHKPFAHSIPISYENGHTFLTWKANKFLFTQNELERLHQHFYTQVLTNVLIFLDTFTLFVTWLAYGSYKCENVVRSVLG